MEIGLLSNNSIMEKKVCSRNGKVEAIESEIYADEDLLAKNWFSKEDAYLWNDLYPNQELNVRISPF